MRSLASRLYLPATLRAALGPRMSRLRRKSRPASAATPAGPGLTRRGALSAGGLGVLALGLSGCASDDFEPAASHDTDAPNALLIIMDSTRADYLSAYNSRALTKTPNIDALARESLVFDLAVPESM